MSPRVVWTALVCALWITFGLACGWPSSSPRVEAPKDPTPAQRYAEDCDARLEIEWLGDDVNPEAVECEHLPIPQSCSSDPGDCYEQMTRCGERCVPDCVSCRSRCVEGCGACRAACAEGDAACALACGEARATCQVSCLHARDACVAPCVAPLDACVAAFEVERERICPDCERISECPFPGSDPTAPCGENLEDFVEKFPGNDPRCFGWCVLF